MAAHILAVDVGTTSTKLALFDQGGVARVTLSRSYETHHGPDGHAEQNPLDWWRALCHLVLIHEGDPSLLLVVSAPGRLVCGHLASVGRPNSRCQTLCSSCLVVADERDHFVALQPIAAAQRGELHDECDRLHIGA